MENEVIKNRILEVMSVVFGVKKEELPSNASPDLIETWDSLNHMNLIVALEEEFGVEFTDEEMVDFLDFNTIESIIKEKVDE